MSSSFGRLFRITTFGESHGAAVGVVVDGCPPRLPLAAEDIQHQLDRRRPGQSAITTQRRESDTVEILSGVFEGRTLGTPIAMLVRNQDARSGDYDEMRTRFRPSHADYTFDAKYGIRDWRGGGRSSARETIARVAAGAVARQVLAGIEVVAYVRRVRDIDAAIDPATVTEAQVDANPVRCPDAGAAARMLALIDEMRRDGNSVGGVVEVVARGVPAGLGDPVFDKLHAELGKALLSIPAAKGFEVGSGFAGTLLTGREHNDAFYAENGRVRTRTNRSGGVQGGVSNGESIVARVAFKPTATIMHEQETVDIEGKPAVIKARGRHDPCVLPRAVPVVEAMTALVLADALLAQRAQCG